MRTTKDITTIYLEKETETRALYNEIMKVWAKLKIESVLEVAKNFPLLLDLSQRLRDELDWE